MPRYLCLQRPIPDGESRQLSPSDRQAVYARFGAWQEKYKAHIVDAGGPVITGRLVTHEAGAGPAEVTTIGGYMIVSAANLEEAVDVARECPGLVQPGSGVEVLEIRGA